MRRGHGLIGATVVIVVTTGCSDSVEIGACRRVDPSEADAGEALPASIPPASTWIVIDSYSAVGAPADPPVDRTVGVEAEVAGREVELFMHDLTADDLQHADLPVHALVQPTASYDPYVIKAYTVVEGDVVFLGECENRAQEVLTAVAQRTGRDDAELMDEFVRLGQESELSRELSST